MADNTTQTPEAARKLSYDAAKPTTRRKHTTRRIKAEQVVLPAVKRDKVIATAQDQVRNTSLVAWMVRRHLDYVSRFKVQFRHENEGLTKLVNRIFRWHAAPANFDISGRLGREEMFRLFELEKVIAGDAAIIKLENGFLQAVESDLIAYPKQGSYDRATKRHANIPPEVVTNVERETGLVMDTQYPGRISQFCICNRLPNGEAVSYDHLEDAVNVIFDAYYTRFSSQVRGVSPLTTALNSVIDVGESVDYTLAKVKMHALMGMAIMRDADSGLTDDSPAALPGFDDDDGCGGEGGGDGNDGVQQAYNEEVLAAMGTPAFAPGSLTTLDLEPGEKAELLESKTPSAEFRDFTQLVIRLVLLALDIPYSAYDSSASTFAGLIADQNMYEVSCKWKREKNLWKRQEYSNWLLRRIWNDPEDEWNLKQVAQGAGVRSIRELCEMVEWVATGFPWLQKQQEVNGDSLAIGLGLDNPVDAARRRGVDVFKNLDKTAEVYKYAQKLGVPLVIGQPGQQVVDAPAGDNDKKGDNNG